SAKSASPPKGKPKREPRRRRRPSRPTLPKLKRPSMPKVKPPKLPGDLWFRFVTRLRAMGYWLREKAQITWRWLRRAAVAAAYWWSMRSRAFKIQIFSVAGVVVLYLIIKFLPVPGVPCEVSAAKECAPSNATIAFVPRDAVLYAHVTVNGGSHQSELASDLRDKLPSFTALIQQSTDALTGAPRPIDVATEVLPWAEDDIALVGVPGPKKTTPEAYVVGIGNTAKADAFLASLTSGATAKHGT